MHHYLSWILVISGCVAAVGFWAYTFEMIRGKVDRSTRWSDLTGYQLEVVILTLGGGLVFLSTLIGAAILRSIA